MESMVLAATSVRFPALNTSVLVAIALTAFNVNEPSLMNVDPV